MSVAGHGNCWNTDANGIEEDENLENIFSILDFPMESLEGNGFGDWDVSKSQYLGPIPSNVLMEPLMNVGPTHVSSGPAASIDGAPEPRPVSDHVQGSSGSDILQPSNPPRIQDSVFFQTQSPISVLESSGSCSTQKSSPIKSDLAIPVRTRSKRVRASGVNPWLSVAPLLTSASASQKALNVRPYKQRKRSSPLPVVPESNKVPFQKVEHSLHITLRGVLPAVTKRCSHCEVTKTPQWREGPSGPKTLCNACGVRYRSGRLFPEYRPAASPTFVSSVHSNSHKKVVEMRTKGKHVPSKIYVPPISSPQPEFPEYRPAASPTFIPSIHSNASNAHKVVEIPSKGKHVPGKIYEPPTSPQPEFIPMSSYLFDYISESGALSPRV